MPMSRFMPSRVAALCGMPLAVVVVALLLGARAVGVGFVVVVAVAGKREVM